MRAAGHEGGCHEAAGHEGGCHEAAVMRRLVTQRAGHAAAWSCSGLVMRRAVCGGLVTRRPGQRREAGCGGRRAAEGSGLRREAGGGGKRAAEGYRLARKDKRSPGKIVGRLQG
jgi:hypothetical protein